MRHNRKTRAEQAGNTASVKLLLPTVLCLAPPVFILLIGPATLDFRDFINREREESSLLVEQANIIGGPSQSTPSAIESLLPARTDTDIR